MAMDLLNSGMGDEGRLRFILECIANNKPLYKTDMIFLESMNNQLEQKIKNLKGSDQKQEKSHPKTLISEEQLDRILDENASKNTERIIPARKKRSIFARIFSR